MCEQVFHIDRCEFSDDVIGSLDEEVRGRVVSVVIPWAQVEHDLVELGLGFVLGFLHVLERVLSNMIVWRSRDELP